MTGIVTPPQFSRPELRWMDAATCCRRQISTLSYVFNQVAVLFKTEHTSQNTGQRRAR